MKNKRVDYQTSELRRKDLVESPMEMFRIWFEQVEGIHPFESTAMTLSTTSKDGKPSSRVVLLKGYDENGFVFYTNYESRKGREIEENPYGSLNFYWPSQERQVRINGKLRKVSRSKTEKYFHSRPLRSQIAALTSNQSGVIENRGALKKKFDELEKEFEGKDVPLPENWGGYRLEHRSVEFWQGRRDRMHDRFVYIKNGTIWQVERLAP
uniref:Pyridoxamine 5'-phosphate oxidase (PdxH, PNPO) n=1 Tax=uncultured marine group II/III euryarchaeote KM3_203_F09 TaxID=1456423 RepID=A0A075GX75_9EURY|nr:Pyridoxamine 5'-phosphate oxidase (pdxH, PNPO) [uncultured marine group II/III euryarchaeote KM3_203_F09]